MKSHYKQLWVSALRSGQYRQTQGKLMNELDLYCAMGVLIDAMRRASKYRYDGHDYNSNGPTWNPAITDEQTYYRFMTHSSVAPSPILYETGLTDTQEKLIMKLNDSGSSFEEIADFIDRDIDSDPELEKTVERMIAKVSVPRPSFFSTKLVSQKLVGQLKKLVEYG